MKVLRHAPEQLVLDHTPWVLSFVILAFLLSAFAVAVLLPLSGEPMGLLALPFLIVGFMLFKGIARRSQAIFDRSAGEVTLRYRTLSEYKSETFALEDVDRAEVEERKSTAKPDGRRSVTFRPALRIGSELKPLTFLSTGSDRHKETVDMINRWLAQ